MVSARREGSSMEDTEVSTSGATFLDSFTYWSNWLSRERASTSASLPRRRGGAASCTLAMR